MRCKGREGSLTVHLEQTDLVPYILCPLVQGPEYAFLSYMQGYFGRSGLEVKPKLATGSVGDTRELFVVSSRAVVMTETSAAPDLY